MRVWQSYSSNHHHHHHHHRSRFAMLRNRDAWECVFLQYWSVDPNWDPVWWCLCYHMSCKDPLNDVSDDHAALHGSLMLVRHWQLHLWRLLGVYVEVDAWEEMSFRCWYTGNRLEWDSCRRLPDLVRAVRHVHRYELRINVAIPEEDSEEDWLEWAWFLDFCHELAAEVVICEHVRVSYRTLLCG
jgi:hypothetical protein